MPHGRHPKKSKCLAPSTGEVGREQQHMVPLPDPDHRIAEPSDVVTDGAPRQTDNLRQFIDVQSRVLLQRRKHLRAMEFSLPARRCTCIMRMPIRSRLSITHIFHKPLESTRPRGDQTETL